MNPTVSATLAALAGGLRPGAAAVTLYAATVVVVVALLSTATALLMYRRRGETVPCVLDLEATQGHFHAHVALVGRAVEAGDAVLVHGAPSRIALGEQRTIQSRATVYEAGVIRRTLVRWLGPLQVTELYDVGFEG
jgi:hypothetical protein